MNLRQLSRQFASGEIDRAQYQRYRAELIERVLASLNGAAENTDPQADPETGSAGKSGRTP